ncbi:MAG: diguanylate cyclase [Ruminococcus sp.]|nr:diguanylate cyclase [Ruminococcus sp.]
MTNKKNKNISIYRFTAIMLAVVCLFNTSILTVIYFRARFVNKSVTNSIQYLSNISDKLATVDDNVLLYISKVKKNSSTEAIQNAKAAFKEIERNMQLYEEEKNHSEAELKRYEQAKSNIQSYNNKLNSSIYTAMSNGDSTVAEIYLNEVYVVKNAAKDNIASTADLAVQNSETLNKRNSVLHGVAQLILLIFLIVGEISIFLAIRRARRNEEELEERSSALDAAGRRLQMSQQKMEDIALTNILTGMKNRYALESDIVPRLESDQFNIAVFDLDRFRQINDMFGYDFGDEYLSMIAEQLKSNFGDITEIYNIVGNEFCFIFNSDVPDSQAQRTAEKILAVMSAPYEVNRIMTQLTASGSIYHYLPNDCLNLDSLLIKMDTTLRQAKANGGNSIYKVNSL